MHELEILRSLVAVIAASLLVVYALRRARVPIVAAFILAGVIIGPGGLGVVSERERIDVIAEIGVALLLFSIGLKLSLRDFMRLRLLILGGGGLQVALTTAATAAVAIGAGEPAARAVFYGFLVAQSSTAVFLKLLEERGETDAIHGRFGVSVSVFQDLGTVPMIMLLPLLGGAGLLSLEAAGLTLAKSLGMVALIIVAARSLFPWLMTRVVRTRSREVFTLTTLLVALGTAWLGSLAGLSLSLGAFLAGIVISDSEYSQQALAEIVPLKDALSSLFFVSVGMMVDPAYWLTGPLELFGLGLAVVLGKALIIAGIALGFGLGPRVAVLAGLGLGQIGEFSFILARAGAPHGLIDGERYQAFLSVTVLTLVLAPLATRLSPHLATRTDGMALPPPRTGWKWGRGRGRGREGVAAARSAGADRGHLVVAADELSDHVIIVGYGINGRNVARVLRRLGVAYTVLELNPLTVGALREQEEPVLYGDAASRDVLIKAGVKRARVVVAAIADPASSRQIVAVARGINPGVRVVVRTRYVAEVEALYALGADEVVPEEFETSLELAGAAMAAYGAPGRVIEQEKAAIRRERYQLLSSEGRPARAGPPLHQLLGAADIAPLEIAPGSPGAGASLRSLELRGRAGASIVAVDRGGRMIGNPEPDFELAAGDVVYLWGQAAQIEAARGMLEKRP